LPPAPVDPADANTASPIPAQVGASFKRPPGLWHRLLLAVAATALIVWLAALAWMAFRT
jgi:hypothetical protein